MAPAAVAPSALDSAEFDRRLEDARATGQAGPKRDVVWTPQPGSQTRFMQAPYFEVLVHGTRGGGKRLRVDQSVLTDSGWKPAGDVTMDDRLVAVDGSYTKLLGIFRGRGAMNEVEFSDGVVVVADDEHLWRVYDQKNRYWSTKTTEQVRGSKRRRHVPLLEAPAPGVTWTGYDPYAIGLLIGDGTTSGRNPTVYNPEAEIRDHLVGLGWRCYDYPYRAVHQLTLLGGHDILGDDVPMAKGDGKYVPKRLLLADPDTRLALLQGLLDSDGHCDKEGRVQFSSVSRQLAEDVCYLARSLGGKARVRESSMGRNKFSDRETYFRVSVTHAGKFVPFRLRRHVARLRMEQHGGMRRIVRVDPCGEADGVCFAVAHPSHLYVTEGFVVTHNTDALLMDFAQHVGAGHGRAWRGVLFRQTYPQLADVVAKSERWFRRIFPAALFNRARMEWEFPDGEVLQLRHMARHDDYFSYHGHEFPWIGWEELTNWADDECYRLMFACCRSSKPGVPRKVRATTNPYGTGHGWVKERFRLHGQWWKTILIDDAVDKKGRPEPMRCAIHSHLSENKVLLAADPDYERTIAASARNDAQARAWMHGSWDVVAGGMFDDVWSQQHNVVEPFDVPASWRIDRAFDWGSTRPFSVGWYAESDGSDLRMPDGSWRSTVRGDLFRIREWYGWTGRANEGTKDLAIDVAAGIVQRELEWGWRRGRECRVSPGQADSAIFAVENGVSVAVDMARSVRVDGRIYDGVRWVPSDKRPGSRKMGWEMMRRRIRAAQPRKDLPREDAGFFVVADACPHFMRTVLSLPRDKKDLDDVDTNAEDHVADEVRYRVRAMGTGTGSGTVTGWY